MPIVRPDYQPLASVPPVATPEPAPAATVIHPEVRLDEAPYWRWRALATDVEVLRLRAELLETRAPLDQYRARDIRQAGLPAALAAEREAMRACPGIDPDGTYGLVDDRCAAVRQAPRRDS
jgi:hypothetical protein